MTTAVTKLEEKGIRGLLTWENAGSASSRF